MKEVVIVSAVRTPIGSFRGVFSALSAVDLGAEVVRSLLARCSLSVTEVDELIFGQVLTAGCGQTGAPDGLTRRSADRLSGSDGESGLRFRAESRAASGAGDPQRRRPGGHRRGAGEHEQCPLSD